MTNQRTASIVVLTLIAFIVPVSSALGASAGDEYLPQLPDSGGSSLGAGSSGAGSAGGSTSGSSPASAGTGTVAPQTDGSGPQARETHKRAKKGHKSNRQQALALASDPGGGDGSGSILLSPLVIAMIAAVVAAAVGMTLSRRKGDHEGAEGERRPKGGRMETDGPRTPDGEIIAGPDQAT